jgi:hypothetical protein
MLYPYYPPLGTADLIFSLPLLVIYIISLLNSKKIVFALLSLTP